MKGHVINGMTWETYFCLAHFMFNHLNNTVTTRRERRKKNWLEFFPMSTPLTRKASNIPQLSRNSLSELHILFYLFPPASFFHYLETRTFRIQNDREGRVYPWHAQSLKKSIWERDKGSKMTGFNAFKCTPHKDKLQISFCFSSLVIKLDQTSPPKYAL